MTPEDRVRRGVESVLQMGHWRSRGPVEVVHVAQQPCERRIRELESAVSEYLKEWDTPAPELMMRRVRRDQLRAALGDKP